MRMFAPHLQEGLPVWLSGCGAAGFPRAHVRAPYGTQRGRLQELTPDLFRPHLGVSDKPHGNAMKYHSPRVNLHSHNNDTGRTLARLSMVRISLTCTHRSTGTFSASRTRFLGGQ